MKILVFSDSHGNVDCMAGVVRKNKDVGMIIHLGDVVKDAIRLGVMFKDIRIDFVAGNNDVFSRFPFEKILYVEGKNILLTHGHKYNIKRDYSELIARGKRASVDLVLFGHTHVAQTFLSEEITFLNPGSIGLPIGRRRATYAMIDLSQGAMATSIVEVNS